ncbi:MAG: ribose 5-phosphate isomerase A [Candidatus Altiarchaeales archaeon]|nr:MAG: ribose 5-phosphate isomerase A [Candidatus Altiarchaeales archaeon]
MNTKFIELSKKSAALKAVEYLKNGMIVGLGTGSTAEYAVREIARMIGNNALNIIGVPTSRRTEKLARELEIPILKIESVKRIDIDIDGADYVDGKFNLIKGGGGAHTMEKIVAKMSDLFIVIVDYTKLVDSLDSCIVPIEVHKEKVKFVSRELKKINGIPRLRKNFITDSGNFILDTKFNNINPKELEHRINDIDGVVENGIFSERKPDIVIVGRGNNVEVLNRST